MNQQYLDECKQIQQNATYSAEAHHLLAGENKSRALKFQLIPAIATAVFSSVVAAGVATSGFWVWLPVVSAVAVAVASVLNPGKAYQDHLGAAKGFTILKHDARFLHEAQSTTMSEAEFALAVQYLHQRYNELLQSVPSTDGPSFVKAQTVIRGGAHDPDRNSDGSIK